MSDVEMKENENTNEQMKENENTEDQMKENENTEDQMKENENTEEQMKENENTEEQMKEYENTEEQLKENENTEKQLVNEEQPPENSLVHSEFNHQQEEKSLSPIQDNQIPGEIKFTEDTSVDNKIPEQNGDKDHNLSIDEKQEPMKKHSVSVAEEFDNEQDDSEKTEVAEYENEGVDDVQGNEKDPVTPTSLIRCSNAEGNDEMKGTSNNWLESEIMDDEEDGSLEEQTAFMNELECFYRERGMKFSPPKFYQQTLNWLKLWRAVIKLGGYDLVTTMKLWRQVGVSFNPPKTCTTVSWTFRIFYEKALLEYEKHKVQNGELQFSAVAIPESSSVDNDANGHQGPGLSGRARRDTASRAIQGWHVQKSFDNGAVGGDPTIMDKNYNHMPKREKSLKSIGSVKHKRPAEIDHTMKLSRTETGKQMIITVEDVGPPADWVKINVREAEDCFEVYALVPGLLREEVRVQSDPAGRLVITGQPEQPDNPWGITPFRKVVTLPGRIDPLQTSAVVSLHGRLYVRVPFEESDI